MEWDSPLCMRASRFRFAPELSISKPPLGTNLGTTVNGGERQRFLFYGSSSIHWTRRDEIAEATRWSALATSAHTKLAVRRPNPNHMALTIATPSSAISATRLDYRHLVTFNL